MEVPHLMVSEEVINEIVSLAELDKEDYVLEIGSGTGNLTKKILEKTENVLAVEKDEKLASILKTRFPNLTVKVANVLEIEIDSFDKIISNLPYSISEPLVWKLIRTEFKLAVLTVPLSFAKILTASKQDKEYSKLSLIFSKLLEMQIVKEVPKEVFVPKADTVSCIITIKKKPYSIYSEIFSQYDKKFVNALREILIKYGKTKKEAKEIIENLNLHDKLYTEKVSHLSLKELEIIDKTIEEHPEWITY